MVDKTVQLTARDQFRTLKRFATYAKPFKKYVFLSIFFLLLSTFATLAVPYVVKVFIDDYLTPRHFPATEITTILVIFIVCQIVAASATFMSVYYFDYLAYKMIQQLRIDAFDKLDKLGMRYFDKVAGGSIVSRLTNDTEAIVEMVVTAMSSMLVASVMVIASYVMMFVLDVRLAWMALLFFPIIITLVAVYRKYSARVFSSARQRLSDLNAKLAESIEGMRMIQAFNQQQRLRKSFNEINDDYYKLNMTTIRLDGLLLSSAINMVGIFAIAVILSYFGVLGFGTSAVSVGVIYAFIQYMQNFFQPMSQVSQNLNVFQQSLVSTSRVFELIDEAEFEPQQDEQEGLRITEGQVVFDDVSFSYDGHTDVLKHISFTAHPGETVALVGHTGSGKSSIINLFMRFYEFERGNIYIDGQSIKKIPKRELKANIGLVLQDAFIFYGTVASNIKLYHPTMTFEQVKAAAEFVQANTFIEKLPGKYEHKVVEKGNAFSTGERQLLAFARTIATDPKILILDEATANIDSETEEKIQQSLNVMRKGRTTLAIAHRLSTIQDADQILVLNRGEIVERGTHETLIAQKGIYYNMYVLQNG